MKTWKLKNRLKESNLEIDSYVFAKNLETQKEIEFDLLEIGSFNNLVQKILQSLDGNIEDIFISFESPALQEGVKSFIAQKAMNRKDFAYISDIYNAYTSLHGVSLFLMNKYISGIDSVFNKSFLTFYFNSIEQYSLINFLKLTDFLPFNKEKYIKAFCGSYPSWYSFFEKDFKRFPSLKDFIKEYYPLNKDMALITLVGFNSFITKAYEAYGYDEFSPSAIKAYAQTLDIDYKGLDDFAPIDNYNTFGFIGDDDEESVALSENKVKEFKDYIQKNSSIIKEAEYYSQTDNRLELLLNYLKDFFGVKDFDEANSLEFLTENIDMLEPFISKSALINYMRPYYIMENYSFFRSELISSKNRTAKN